jgi:hypothetical protein
MYELAAYISSGDSSFPKDPSACRPEAGARQSLSRRMRAPLLALAALLASVAAPLPCGAHPRLIWGGVDGAAASSESWLLSLRDRSHAVALCAEA